MDDSAPKTCKKCGAENPPQARFCGSCGSLLLSSLEREAGPVHSLGVSIDSVGLGSEAPAERTAQTELNPAAGGPAGAALEDPAVNEAVAQQYSVPPAVNPDLPGAGLAPGAPIPPPQAQGAPSQAVQAGLQHAQADSARHYQVPPPGYGYSLPNDGNTSGMGSGYPVPEAARGWSFAGFVPFGLFAFVNGMPLWGAIGLIASIFFSFLYAIYAIIVGVMGKEQAWQNRRFDSLQQYQDVMRAWNTWGLILLVVGGALMVLNLMLALAVFGYSLTSSF